MMDCNSPGFSKTPELGGERWGGSRVQTQEVEESGCSDVNSGSPASWLGDMSKLLPLFVSVGVSLFVK